MKAQENPHMKSFTEPTCDTSDYVARFPADACFLFFRQLDLEPLFNPLAF